MTRRSIVLAWIERSLLAVGAVLAAWSAVMIIEARYFIPVPEAGSRSARRLLPGEGGNVGIAAHRDTVFRPLRRLRVGDTLALSTADYVYRYRVTDTRIVKPEDVEVLDPKGHPTLTLVTCYPFTFIGPAPLRFVVSADLTGEETRTSRAGEAGAAGRIGR